MNNLRNLQKDQRGLVSIMVTLILMLIISLIVIGFAQIVRREQRQVLDRQLSTQAFYAAESGINAATKIIRAELAVGTDPEDLEKDECEPDSTYDSDTMLDAANNVSFSCLLVDPAPYSLDYSSLETTKSQVIPVISEDGNTITRIDFSWHDTSTGSKTFSCPAQGEFVEAAAWPAACNAGMLRLDIVPINAPITRTNLATSSKVLFIHPRNSGSTTAAIFNASVNAQGATASANCNNSALPKSCNISIVGLSSTDFYVRVRPLYRPASLSIVGYSGSTAQRLMGAQAIIDSTGKANDVLRRIVTRLPLNSLGVGTPDAAIFSASTICKRFTTYPGSFSHPCTGESATAAPATPPVLPPPTP